MKGFRVRGHFLLSRAYVTLWHRFRRQRVSASGASSKARGGFNWVSYQSRMERAAKMPNHARSRREGLARMSAIAPSQQTIPDSQSVWIPSRLYRMSVDEYEARSNQAA